MPRPTAAEIAYGSATVVFSTLAMLLFSQTRSGIGITICALAGLAIGLLVALRVQGPRRASRIVATGGRSRAGVGQGARTTRPRAQVGTAPRVEEHSSLPH